MYIKKYWGNFIGGSDDSLNLVAFLEDQKKEEIPLSKIFDIHLSFLTFTKYSAIENTVFSKKQHPAAKQTALLHSDLVSVIGGNSLLFLPKATTMSGKEVEFVVFLIPSLK